MSRPYPLDPIPEDHADGRSRSDSWINPDGLAMQSASAVARKLLEFGEWRRQHQDLSRAVGGTIFLLLGLLLVSASAITDIYLHRGVETGDERPYVVQPTGMGKATNVDLRPYTDDDRQSVVSAIDGAGFEYVRQPVSWAELEPEPGQYAFDELQSIVASLERYDLHLIVVIGDSPEWARGPLPVGVIDGPPDSVAAFQDFMTALTSTFQATLPYVQVWDEPNEPTHWSGNVATGDDFLSLLAAGYDGAKEGSSEVRIVFPELAVNAGSPDRAQVPLTRDLDFLQEIYTAGGDAFFDVLGIRLDGGTLSPDDRRIQDNRINMSRGILFREMMLREGDSSTPIWATSFGWAATGQLSRSEQAEFVVRGMERSWEEWPWMGVMIQWTFLARRDSPNASYAIIQQDGSATPLYQRLISVTLSDRAARANTGFSPMNAAAVSYTGRWEDQNLENRTFRTTGQVGSSMTIGFEGTGLIAFVRSGPQVGLFRLEIDGRVVSGGGGEDGNLWNLIDLAGTNDFPRKLAEDLGDGPHTARITLVTEGELTLGGFEIVREAPFVWPVILMTIGAMILLFFGLRSFAYLVAVRAGHLSRKSPVASYPQLPRMPQLQPARRT